MKIQEKQNFNNYQKGYNVLGPLPDEVSVQMLVEIFNDKFGYFFPCEDGKALVATRTIHQQRKSKDDAS
jgi:hypothetical protein